MVGTSVHSYHHARRGLSRLAWVVLLLSVGALLALAVALSPGLDRSAEIAGFRWRDATESAGRRWQDGAETARMRWQDGVAGFRWEDEPAA